MAPILITFIDEL